MNINNLLNDLKKKCNEIKLKRAEKIFLNDDVKIDRIIKVDNNEFEISALVESENSDIVYDTDVIFDCAKEEITLTYCECKDYDNNNPVFDDDSTYFCKHCAAVVLEFCHNLKIGTYRESDFDVENNKDYDCNNIIRDLEYINSPKEKLNLELYINHTYDVEDNMRVSLKIGKEKLYVVSDIKEFFNVRRNLREIHYGQKFTYKAICQNFSEEDERLLDYLSDIYFSNNGTYYYSIAKGKYLYVSCISLKNLLKLCTHRKVNFNNKSYNVKNEDIPINIKFEENKDEYNVIVKEKIIPLTTCSDVYIYNDDIYIPGELQFRSLLVLFNYFINKHNLVISKKHSNAIFNSLLPKLSSISNNLDINKEANNIVKEECSGSFYIDEKKEKLNIEIKVAYGKDKINIFHEINSKDKIIIRDNEKERKLISIVNELGFSQNKDVFELDGNDDKEFEFLTKGCLELKEYGDVYYSDKVKNRRIYNTPTLSATISEGEKGYLDFSFTIDDIDKKETKNILNAIKENKNYLKLKDKSIINLQSKEIKDFFNMIDNISDKNIKDNKLLFSKNKSILLDNYIDEKGFKFVKGQNIVKDISEKLNNISKLNYEIPKELHGTLRDYQITGYKWFKALSYLQFGGVLADEMGLGKTIQTIAFLLSEKGKKSLIIAPTSLIYNWKNEFDKFAPSLKVAIAHGSKNVRKDIINNYKEYDVILTTYGTLRNDIELYDNMILDYCILDEGQNIKNPLSKVSEAVKEISADVKFVLTGTPIENNLLELWSIFDFIMPGYLYTSGAFKKKYIDNDDNKEDLIKHISPFILRREKSQVIKELPEKIEKKYYVEMNPEQKKVYKVFVDDIKEKLDNSNYEDDKITIFSYLTKLRQICLDPSLVVKDYKGKSAKIEEVISIVKDKIEDNNKILLFSQFTSVLGTLSKKLDKQKIKYMYLDGSVKADKRLKLVDEFNNSNDCRVFLISLKAGGTGLNLTSANIVIHFDPWWNPAIEDQASDRAHRIGQKNIVNVIKMISEGTIEEKIIKLQEEKKKLIGDIINNEHIDNNSLAKLSTDEIKELFR